MPPCKYCTEKERINARKAQQLHYTGKDWKCDVCNIVIRLGNKTNHLESKIHCKNQSPASERVVRTWRCDICNVEINCRCKVNHLQSKKHIKNEYNCKENSLFLVSDDIITY